MNSVKAPCDDAASARPQVVDYALGTEPLRASYAGSDATKFDLLIDMVGGDVLEFAVAHLLRPGAAIAHIVNSGSNAAANEKHKAASDAGAGPRWNVILAYPSGAELAEIAQLLASGKAKLNIGHKLPVEQVLLLSTSPLFPQASFPAVDVNQAGDAAEAFRERVYLITRASHRDDAIERKGRKEGRMASENESARARVRGTQGNHKE